MGIAVCWTRLHPIFTFLFVWWQHSLWCGFLAAWQRKYVLLCEREERGRAIELCSRWIYSFTHGPFTWIPVLGFSDQRFYSGAATAVFAGFLVYTFLEPLFVPVGSETSMVFLYILTIDGALVGMSLGVLLPALLPGICLGGSLALLAGAFSQISNSYFFPVLAGVLATGFAFLSVR